MPGRVLVVEDDPTIRLAIQAGLESEGYRVWAVADVQEAQTVLHYEGVQVVILDWMLRSAADGLTLCQSIKSNPATKHVAVIMLTARSSPARREQAQQVGVNVFLPKPYRLPRLLEALQITLDGEPAEVGSDGEPTAVEPSLVRREYQIGPARLQMPGSRLTNCDSGAVIYLTRGEGWILENLARYSSVVPYTVLRRVAQQHRGGGLVRMGALRSMVWEINKKLRQVGLPEIQTQRNVGYRWLIHTAGSATAADFPDEWEVQEYRVGPAHLLMPMAQVMHCDTRAVAQLQSMEGWILEALAAHEGVVTYGELCSVVQQHRGQRMKESSMRERVRQINLKLRQIGLPAIQAQHGVGYYWLAHDVAAPDSDGVMTIR